MFWALYIIVVLGGSSDSINGRMELSSDIVLDWELINANGPKKGVAKFTLSWNATYDWASFGLHNKLGLSMPDSEIFMCSIRDQDAMCQYRNSKRHRYFVYL